MAFAPATLPQRLRHLSLNVFSFSLCYLLANSLAQQQSITRHVALPFEVHIPFLQWMILPYLSSGLFFCLVFFRAASSDALRVVSQRLLLATVAAAMVFILYPLQFSWPRPPVSSGLCARLFQGLSLVDQPFNQLPSLHVAYCLIYWQALRPTLAAPWARIALAIWLMATALSTLFTFQHHALDVLGGALLGWACCLCIRPGRLEPAVAFYYLMAAGMALIVGFFGLHHAGGLYVACSLLLVSRAYSRHDRHFLHKAHGRHPLWIWLLYAPYLLGYRLTWYAVRWRERRKPAVLQMADNLWVGRRLSDGEACRLPANCTIIDLANELSETPSLRAHRYRYFPLLDLQAPPTATLGEIVAVINEELAADRQVYLHCAMGYSRSVRLADAYLEQSRQ